MPERIKRAKDTKGLQGHVKRISPEWNSGVNALADKCPRELNAERAEGPAAMECLRRERSKLND